MNSRTTDTQIGVNNDVWLNATQLRTWITLSAFLEAFPAAVEAQLKQDTGINQFEYNILAMLSEQDDCTLVMTDLANVAFGSLSRLSHAVTRLEKRGWVQRSTGSGGRRHNTVTLTETGVGAIKAAAPLHAGFVRQALVDPLSDDELETLTRLTRKLIGATNPALDQRLEEMIPAVIARNSGNN